MKKQLIGIMMMVSLLLVISACSNGQEVQQPPTEESENEVEMGVASAQKDGNADAAAEGTGVFMVTAFMDCCPPSVVEDAIAEVEGAGKTDIHVDGSTAEVTVTFDETKTSLDAIKIAVADIGLPVE